MIDFILLKLEKKTTESENDRKLFSFKTIIILNLELLNHSAANLRLNLTIISMQTVNNNESRK